MADPALGHLRSFKNTDKQLLLFNSPPSEMSQRAPAPCVGCLSSKDATSIERQAEQEVEAAFLGNAIGRFILNQTSEETS